METLRCFLVTVATLAVIVAAWLFGGFVSDYQRLCNRVNQLERRLDQQDEARWRLDRWRD